MVIPLISAKTRYYHVSFNAVKYLLRVAKIIYDQLFEISNLTGLVASVFIQTIFV